MGTKFLTAVTFTMVVVLAAGASAQVASSFQDVVKAGRLMSGEGVYVTTVDGRRQKASVVDASAAGLVLSDGRRQWRVAEVKVVKVERRDSIHGGTWIGIGIGLLTAPVSCNFGRYCAFAPFVGGLIGALVDVGMREVVYEAITANTTRVTLSPIAAEGGAGAGVSVIW